MGKQKKEANRVKAEGGGKGLGNLRLKGENYYHDAAKVKRLNMYKGGRAVRDRDGKVVKAAPFQSREAPIARVEPNRKWFGNTRVIGQQALETFRDEMSKRVNDPYQVLMRQSKLPLSLLAESTKISQVKMLETEAFSHTFGPKSQRKRPKLAQASLSELVNAAEGGQEGYDEAKDGQLLENQVVEFNDATRDWVFFAGQSKRIWNELYKVIDSSDVVIHVLDARDPLGTRCRSVEKYLKEEAKHKHLVFLLNKVDLVPTWVTARWVKILSKEYPTLAFHASITHSFGKGSLIQLLRQFSRLHADKKQISVGFIGYPNTGKSSIINTLKSKKVCNVAPIPGETKVWQYITLMRRIFLIDCPGVVHPGTSESEAEIILKGVVRVENVKLPEQYIADLLPRVRPEYLSKTYNVESWSDHEDFLTLIAKQSGRLLKGGEPDLSTVAKMVINDWLRGRIPYYVQPPDSEEYLAKLQEMDVGSTGPLATKAKTPADADKAGRKPRVHIGVEQQFSKIPVTSDFLPIDLENNAAYMQAEKEARALAKATTAMDEDSPTALAGHADQAGEQEPDWDEVFQSVVGDKAVPFEPTEAALAEDSPAADDSNGDAMSGIDSASDVDRPLATKSPHKAPKPSGDSDGDDSKYKRQKKEPRMTTNKRKVGTHYYETANVKNRNRRKKPVDPNTQAKRLAAPGNRRAK
ncbi:GTPase required for pre-60S ribosomal subunit nuclear export and maturation [Dimargaris verticillata]|uniref:Nucleolar GTP-binding protein 2 n=1 Tax=Dimargaris verticillata TaxID=2761393 RepID=A0A9W8B007_9FUNG|nr:GTPase required for pre-60S ribosomal subunit nuclear export and maturation [Dimargaris verticillata]